jgi:hypothetical protein
MITPVMGVPIRPSDDGPSDNKRRHPRFTLPARCWIVDGRNTIYMRVHDVSRGGMSLRAPVPFRPTSAIELRIELPGGTTTRARAEVVWVRGGGEPGPRMGARFVEFLDGQDALYKLLERA